MPKEATLGEKKTFKIVSAPEGQPTFIDAVTGKERPFIRISLVRAFSEEEAKAYVNGMNKDLVDQYGGDFYEIMSVEEEQ